MVCGKDNCNGKGFDNTDDCCIEPGKNLTVTLRLLEILKMKNTQKSRMP